MFSRFIAAMLMCALVEGALAQPVGTEAEPVQAQPGDIRPGGPTTLQGFLDRVAAALEAANNERFDAEERKRANRDLQAQEDMAAWALGMLVATAIGVIVTAVGVVFVAITLDLNRKATNAAVRTTTAADETLRAQRAWVLAENVTNNEFSGSIDGVEVRNGLHIKIWWKNYGQNPAMNVRTAVEFAFTGINDPVPAFTRAVGVEKAADMGQGKLVSSFLVFNDMQHAMFLSRNARVYIYGKMVYHEIFERSVERTTEACFEISYDGTILDKDGKEIGINMGVIATGPQNRTT